ncbi:hypothetical protein [Streptacidiphilus monticola]|jgi:hypothetical protein|uniref:Uncharacterized protein n=1 Tax=Streptacidiphilus monticola TaxID=2161674 RepID=A0ABW1G9D2_9ACTN
MADPEFYHQDHPPGSDNLPEDRPRGGGLEDHTASGRRTWPVFLVIGFLLLLMIIFMTV